MILLFICPSTPKVPTQRGRLGDGERYLVSLAISMFCFVEIRKLDLEVGKSQGELWHVAVVAGGEVERDCHKDRVELHEVRVIDVAP